LGRSSSFTHSPPFGLSLDVFLALRVAAFGIFALLFFALLLALPLRFFAALRFRCLRDRLGLIRLFGLGALRGALSTLPATAIALALTSAIATFAALFGVARVGAILTFGRSSRRSEGRLGLGEKSDDSRE
jgi:hypothetical protein